MVREAHLLLEGHCKRKAARRKGRQQLGWTTSAQPRPWHATRASSHCETGLVSRRILGLLASCQSLPSRSRAGGPAAAYACSHLGLVLADSPARHGFCSLSIAETESPGKTPCVAGGEKQRASSSQRGIRMATPLRHTTSGTTAAPCPWRSVRIYHYWSTRARRWRRPGSVRPIHPGPLAVGRCRSGCPSEAHTQARHACHD